jgi:hypothetical protein
LFAVAVDIAKKIKMGGGKATLLTVEGGTLTAMMDGGKLILSTRRVNFYGYDCRRDSVQPRDSCGRYGSWLAGGC